MIETVSDIKMFILLFVLVAITFADQMFILETYGRARDGYNYQEYQMVPEETKYYFTDALLNSYLLIIGALNFGNFGQSQSRWLVWAFNVAATFITNILFMNMLIGVMADTF